MVARCRTAWLRLLILLVPSIGLDGAISGIATVAELGIVRPRPVTRYNQRWSHMAIRLGPRAFCHEPKQATIK